MKIVVDVPDRTRLIFLNYAFVDNDGALMMGVKQIASDELKEGAEFVTQPQTERSVK